MIGRGGDDEEGLCTGLVGAGLAWAVWLKLAAPGLGWLTPAWAGHVLARMCASWPYAWATCWLVVCLGCTIWLVVRLICVLAGRTIWSDLEPWWLGWLTSDGG